MVGAQRKVERLCMLFIDPSRAWTRPVLAVEGAVADTCLPPAGLIHRREGRPTCEGVSA